MTKQYKKLADSSDALLIKEAIDSLSNVSLTTDLGAIIEELVKELREARIQREGELERLVEGIPQPTPLDIEALGEKIAAAMPSPADNTEGMIAAMATLTRKPTYNFEIERNHSGVLVGIKATPTT